jgi:predicted CopG family antitoxin
MSIDVRLMFLVLSVEPPDDPYNVKRQGLIITNIIVIIVIGMTTIAVDDDVRDELLKISAELQLKLGRRVNYNDVLKYLIENRAKRPELLDRAVVKGLDSERLIRELHEERKRDEEKLERLLRS